MWPHQHSLPSRFTAFIHSYPGTPGNPAAVKPAEPFTPDDGPADSSPGPSSGRVGRSPAGTGPGGSDNSDDERVAEDGILAAPAAEMPNPDRPAVAAAVTVTGAVAGGVVPRDAEEKGSPDSGAASGGGDGGSASGDQGGSAGEGEGDDGGASALEAEVRLEKDEERVAAEAEAAGEGEGAVPASPGPKEEVSLLAGFEPEAPAAADAAEAAPAAEEAEAGEEEDGAYVTATNSSAGESEEDGAYVTAANSDAGDGDSAGEAAVAAHPTVKTASQALGLAARLHDLPNAMVDLTSCRAYRDVRAFHVKVSTNTPRCVWPPPSQPPPPVGRGGGSARRSGGWGARGPAIGRAGSRIAPLRVSHITWDRSVLFQSLSRESHTHLHEISAQTVQTLFLRSLASTPLRMVHRRTHTTRGLVRNSKLRHPQHRADEDLGKYFALNLPLDLVKVTFGFSFNSPVDGVEVDWPPGMKALHFGMAFNPRPGAAAATATAVTSATSATTRSRPAPAPSPSSSGEGAEVGWAKFLAPTLEEVVFGGHFNQPVVSERASERASG